jgi:putative FmdB family regulatory protein
MPIYEYVCMACESHFEELVRFGGDDPSCQACGSANVTRQLSVFTAHGVAQQPTFSGPVGGGGGGCCGGGCGCH